jgi:putative membrane protein
MNVNQPLLPADVGNRCSLTAFLMLWAISCISVPYPTYFWLQHVPTFVVILTMVIVDRYLQISRLSFTLILAFLTLHLLGARYLYSYVPYDYWSNWLLGIKINDRFGFTRNHYDRFVHFSFGLLLVIPAWRLARRGGLDPLWSAAFAILGILAASAAYEIFEWMAALVMAPDWAESYNGQQGDAWDAQKDMVLAACGAAIGLALYIPKWLRPSGLDKVAPRSK